MKAHINLLNTKYIFHHYPLQASLLINIQLSNFSPNISFKLFIIPSFYQFSIYFYLLIMQMQSYHTNMQNSIAANNTIKPILKNNRHFQIQNPQLKSQKSLEFIQKLQKDTNINVKSSGPIQKFSVRKIKKYRQNESNSPKSLNKLRIDLRKNPECTCKCHIKQQKNIFLSECIFKEISKEEKMIENLKNYIEQRQKYHKKEIQIVETMLYELITSYNPNLKLNRLEQDKYITNLQLYNLKNQNDYLKRKYFEYLQKKYELIGLSNSQEIFTNQKQKFQKNLESFNQGFFELKIDKQQQKLSVKNNTKNTYQLDDKKQKIMLSHLFSFQKYQLNHEIINKISEIESEYERTSIKQNLQKNTNSDIRWEYYNDRSLKKNNKKNPQFSLENSIKQISNLQSFLQPLSQSLNLPKINSTDSSGDNIISSLGTQSVISSSV